MADIQWRGVFLYITIQAVTRRYKPLKDNVSGGAGALRLLCEYYFHCVTPIVVFDTTCTFKMKLEFSAPIDELTIANPIINSTDRVASSAVTDTADNPFVIKIHTTATETIHNAKNRAWVDVALTDDECVKVFEQLDEHLLNAVFDRHHTPEWFNKKAPRDIIEEYCKSFIECQKSKPDPFLRLKTSFNQGQPSVELHTSTQKNPEAATVSELTSLESIAGREVVYEVHVGSIRFCPTTFNPELKLVAVHSYVAKEDYNLFEMVLDNATHREQKDKILEKQHKMEEYTENLRQLETLKEQVENEVTQAMAKREDVDQRYNEAMEKITEMQMECAFEGVEDDVTIADAGEDDDAADATDATDATTSDLATEEQNTATTADTTLVEATA